MTTEDHGILAPAWAATGVAEFVDDTAILAAMLATEVALAEAQADLGVTLASAAAAIRTAAVPGSGSTRQRSPPGCARPPIPWWPSSPS